MFLREGSAILALIRMETPPKSQQESTWAAFAFVGQLLGSILAVTLLCALGGMALDKYFHTTWIFTTLGLIATGGLLYPIVMRFGKRINNDKKN